MSSADRMTGHVMALSLVGSTIPCFLNKFSSYLILILYSIIVIFCNGAERGTGGSRVSRMYESQIV